jgi:diguanylate cyclase (GGDEF)-like protein
MVDRLRLREHRTRPEPGPVASPRTRTRIGGALMIAGGALAALTVALPPAARHSELVVIACGVAALAIGLTLLVMRRPAPEWALGLTAAFGTVLITLATYEGGPQNGTADNEILYVWVCIYAFYFLALPNAVFQLGLVGAAYAALLGSEGLAAGDLVTRWLVTVGTLAVGGVIVTRLRGSVERLVLELRDRARTDSLTGILNRHALEERAVLEFARSRREGRPLALLVLDLDGFKAVNDTLGHAAGDEVLRGIAAVLSEETRRIDAVARVGGDEFVILLPGADAGDATRAAERLHQALRERPSGAAPPLTASIGVAVGPGEGDSLDELWLAADRSMYAAKRSRGEALTVTATVRRAASGVEP